MTYNPRTFTGIPTEQVGSLPRPAKMQAAYAAYDAGKIGLAQLEAEQEAAAADSIKRMEAAFQPRSARASVSAPAQEEIVIRCIAPMCRTTICCRACSG
jgi:hypothetical protein